MSVLGPVKLRSLTVRPAGLFSPQNRTSTQSSLPSLVVRVRLTNSIRTVAGAKDSRTRAPQLELGPIGACLIRASLFLFQRISHKRLVLMRFLRSLVSEKSAGLQDHTTSPSASALFVKSAFAFTASHPNVRNDRDTPL